MLPFDKGGENWTQGTVFLMFACTYSKDGMVKGEDILVTLSTEDYQLTIIAALSHMLFC